MVTLQLNFVLCWEISAQGVSKNVVGNCALIFMDFCLRSIFTCSVTVWGVLVLPNRNTLSFRGKFTGKSPQTAIYYGDSTLLHHTWPFLRKFREGISFPNFVERSILELPLSELCTVPFALQNRALFEREKVRREKGGRRGGQQKGRKGKKDAWKQVRYYFGIRQGHSGYDGVGQAFSSLAALQAVVVWAQIGAYASQVCKWHNIYQDCMWNYHSNRTIVMCTFCVP